MSQRQASVLVGLSRSTAQYRATRQDDGAVRQRLKELAHTYRRWGSPKLHTVLRREKLVLNHKRTERIYREERLSLRTKRRKKRPAIRIHMPPATAPNQIWAMDFIFDRLAQGRRIKIFSLIDEFSKECLALEADTSISGVRVAQILESVAVSRGMPVSIRSDNGPEFTGKALYDWVKDRVSHIFIDPGKPTQNPFVESFHDKLRNELLDEHWFGTIKETRERIGDWKNGYNDFRPHSSLNGLTPNAFAKSFLKEQMQMVQKQDTQNARMA